jgi:hypothetical protein
MKPSRSPKDRPAKTGRQQGKFAPGKSGNPSGRPQGSRHKTSLAVEALLEGEAEALTRKAIELAKEGDMAALKLCLDRLAPPRKGRTVSFKLPTIETAEDVLRALQTIATAVAGGEITPDEGATVAALLETHRRTIETVEIEARVAALEARDAQPK